MQKHHTAGFTLIELLFVVAIGIMLATIGVPAYQNLVTSNRLSAGVNDVVTAIQLIRSEASKRGLAVTLCPSKDRLAETPTCAESGGWDDGFIAFVDINANRVINPAGVGEDFGDELLLVGDAAPRNVTIIASEPLANGITYGGDGFPLGLADDSSDLLFCGKAVDADQYRVINLSSTGRPMTMRDGTVPSGLTCPTSGS